MNCSRCGALIGAGGAFCPSCGAPVAPAASPPLPRPPGTTNAPSYAAPWRPKDPTIAVILALLLGLFGLMGIGHLYVGKVARGIVLLLAGLFLVPLAFFFTIFFVIPLLALGAGVVLAFGIIALGLLTVAAWIGLLVWQTFDAHRLAEEFNRRTAADGRAPW